MSYTKESSKSGVLVHTKVRTVEKVLDDHVKGSLPSIRSIADKLDLSESTLKRNFRQVFGTSIYNMYLQKKMLQARQLLIENKEPIKDIARRLGYVKPSNFIRIFKKHYTFSPGSFRKQLMEPTQRKSEAAVSPAF